MCGSCAGRSGGVRRGARSRQSQRCHPQAAGGAFGTFREIDPSILNRNFQINTMGRLYLALLPCDGHRRQGRDTCHWQYVGIARHARLRRLRADQSGHSGFWPRRWHALGPQGVHVAYVVIDAVIDLEWTRNASTASRTSSSSSCGRSRTRSGMSSTRIAAHELEIHGQ